jgi:hypothetical protein
MKLIPVNEVTVYRNVAGDNALGLSSNPLPVTNLIYLDKTDYVVEVTYEGKRGYVRRGFRLSKE